MSTKITMFLLILCYVFWLSKTKNDVYESYKFINSRLPNRPDCMTKLCTQDSHSSCLCYLCYAPTLPVPDMRPRTAHPTPGPLHIQSIQFLSFLKYPNPQVIFKRIWNSNKPNVIKINLEVRKRTF